MFEQWSYSFADSGITLRGVYTPPTGKPLLHFIHGNGFCARTYEPMLIHLAEHFDLWLCDIQGHGLSDAGEKFLGWNQNAAMAAQAFEHHLHKWADVPRFGVGHSFGGVLTALILAKKPKLFQSAVLLDPVMFTPSILLMLTALRLAGKRRATPMAKSALRRKRTWSSRQAAFDALLNRGTYKNWTEEAMWAFVNHAVGPLQGNEEGVQLRTPAHIEADIFSTSPKHLWPLVKQIKVPVLIAYGKNTYDFVGDAARRAKRLNKHFDFQETLGGHCFMQENPEHSSALVRSFLLSLI